MIIPKQNNIVGYWKGNLNQNGTLQDYSGYGNHGTITGADQIDTPFGSTLDFISGNSDKVELGDIGNIKTVSLLVKSDSTTEYFIDLNGTANIDVLTGTIRANNFTSPLFFINGDYDATPTLFANNWIHIAIATGTIIDANAVVLGLIGANYGDCTMAHIILWDIQLNPNEVLQLYQAMMRLPDRR